MKWIKLGHVFSVDGRYPWMNSHAAVPIAEHLYSDIFKVYFSSRDKENRSFTSWVKIDINNPSQILDISKVPVLEPGSLGMFDDSGSMATWLVNTGKAKFLYYIGWNLGITVPFRNSIGVAKEEPTGNFSRLFLGPIVDRSASEPHFCATCCVLQGADKWRIWYQSCVGWELFDAKPRHQYHIKYAESEDGVNWKRNSIIAIDFQDKDEYAICRPTVIHDKGCWRMWYSFRGDKYRIGYAESEDGISWIRKDDQVGIDVSDQGWDSEMIEYSFVFDHKGSRYMLYNGNDYGRTGFGLAILEKE